MKKRRKKIDKYIEVFYSAFLTTGWNFSEYYNVSNLYRVDWRLMNTSFDIRIRVRGSGCPAAMRGD